MRVRVSVCVSVCACVITVSLSMQIHVFVVYLFHPWLNSSHAHHPFSDRDAWMFPRNLWRTWSWRRLPTMELVAKRTASMPVCLKDGVSRAQRWELHMITLQDSLINCSMIQPKPPKVDLEKLMLYTGEVMRFECQMVQLGGHPMGVLFHVGSCCFILFHS